jgi:lysyl-tRNA synthetase class 2
MERLRGQGVEPYPHISLQGRTLARTIALAHDPAQLDHGEHESLRYTVAGRLLSRRGHGAKTFLDLRDRSGSIQLYVERDLAGEEVYERVEELDIGDIVAAEGRVYVTQRGQLALSVHQITLLSKALAPPPAKYHGVADAGTRHRHRELDLMANEQTRELFLTRSRTTEALREWMADQGFIEIETPILQTLAGGASARPFLTHHNALDMELSLRISVELYLNRCMIGGLENVYDLGKCFRNEGISYRHSPEFTMLEWLQSYADHTDVAHFTEEMIAFVAAKVLGDTKLTRDGHTFDLAAPWRRTTMQELVSEVTGVDIMASDRNQLAHVLEDRVHAQASWAQVVHAIYTRLVEPTIIEPTLVFDFPSEPFPITKRHAVHPELAEHFDAVIGGIELVSGDTEQNDPIEQWERFVAQRQQRDGDEDEDAPQPYDEDYVRALEYGLAPSATGGMGVDRLIMILTGAPTLREVIPFPTMRDERS